MSKYPFMKYDEDTGTFYRVLIDNAKNEPFSYHVFIRNIVIEKRETIEHLIMNGVRSEKIKRLLQAEGFTRLTTDVVYQYLKTFLKDFKNK
jgi:hypothetical protein